MKASAPHPQPLTAREIARVAGVSKRGVLRVLQSVSPAGTVLSHGSPARAWSLADLPDTLRRRIEDKTTAAGCRDAHALATTAPPAWQPPFPLADIHSDEISKAARLRKALARAIGLRGNRGVTSAELEAIGAEDFRREFGFAVTARTIRRLLKRTVDRDAFAENWTRLEIYLDGNPRRVAAPLAARIGAPIASGEFRELHDALAGFKDVARPSFKEREAFWDAAIGHLLAQVNEGAAEKPTRLRLLNWLWNSASPWIAKSREALRVAFGRRLALHLAGKSQADGRHARKGIPTKPPIDAETILDVTGRALFQHGGRLAPAVRAVAAELADREGVELDFIEALCGLEPSRPAALPASQPRLVLTSGAAKTLSPAPDRRALGPVAPIAFPAREAAPTSPLAEAIT